MIRVFLFCALMAATITTFAQGPICPSCPTLPGFSSTIAPIVMDAPLRGVVTLVEPHGQFYLNLGTKDQLGANAELLIVRNSFVIGRAKVVKVDWLDSVAVLAPESRGIRLQSGDMVLVQINPIRTSQIPELPPYEISDTAEEIEDVYGLILLAIGVIALF